MSGGVFSFKCREKDCGAFYSRNKSLIMHLQFDHKIHIEKEILEFSDITDFEEWKREYEFKNKCSYIMNCGIKEISGKEVSYYKCSRSGSYKTKSKILKNKCKSLGSCKLNCNCISEIKVVKDSDIFKVEMIKTHYGHELEVCRSRLPRENLMKRPTLHSGNSAVMRSQDPHQGTLETDADFERLDFMTLNNASDLNILDMAQNYTYPKTEEEQNFFSEENNPALRDIKLNILDTSKDTILNLLSTLEANFINVDFEKIDNYIKEQIVKHLTVCKNLLFNSSAKEPVKLSSLTTDKNFPVSPHIDHSYC